MATTATARKAKGKAVGKKQTKPQAVPAVVKAKMPHNVGEFTLKIAAASVPVILYTAARSEDIAFHQYHVECDHQIKQLGNFCPACAGLGDKAGPEALEQTLTLEEVRLSKDDLYRGFDATGKVIQITDDELEAAKPESGKVLEILEFVDSDVVDPISFDASYYLSPDSSAGAAALEVFAVFHAAMGENAVAVTRMVKARHEYLAFIRPYGDGMILYTAFLADEVRPMAFPELPAANLKQVNAARELITAMTNEWEPTKYCVSPETRILTSDLRWVKAGELKVGDKLMGFDELASSRMRRAWKTSLVESACTIERPCFEVSFDDGSVITCSEDHQWLCGRGTSPYKWIRTDELKKGPSHFSRVVKPVDVWVDDDTREAGYLAAAFDGEGSIGHQSASSITHNLGAAVRSFASSTVSRLSFSQHDNAMLATVSKYLLDKSFAFSRGKARPDGRTLCIGRRRDMLRFLGSVRPVRLLDNFSPDLLGRLSGGESKLVKVTKCERIGIHSVVALGTTSKTYIAEGFASHNCDSYRANINALIAAKRDGVEPPKVEHKPAASASDDFMATLLASKAIAEKKRAERVA